MSAAEKKEQNYIAKPPGRRENFISKPKKSNANDKKFKGKSDTRNNNSKGTNGMDNNMPLTKEHQMELGKARSSRHQVTQEDTVRDRLLY